MKLFKSKKAQGISINVIIVAAIALIVLVVLIAIFTGRLGIFAAGLSETQAKADQQVLKFEFGSNCVPTTSALKEAFNKADDGAGDGEKDNNKLDSDIEKAQYQEEKTKLASDCKANTQTECIKTGCIWVP